MTPYQCMRNCQAQQLHQRYDKQLVVGMTQGTVCLCGYDYERKKAAGCKFWRVSGTAGSLTAKLYVIY